MPDSAAANKLNFPQAAIHSNIIYFPLTTRCPEDFYLFCKSFSILPLGYVGEAKAGQMQLLDHNPFARRASFHITSHAFFRNYTKSKFKYKCKYKYRYKYKYKYKASLSVARLFHFCTLYRITCLLIVWKLHQIQLHLCFYIEIQLIMRGTAFFCRTSFLPARTTHAASLVRKLQNQQLCQYYGTEQDPSLVCQVLASNGQISFNLEMSACSQGILLDVWILVPP